MIRISVDLVTLGEVRPLGRMLICNDLSSGAHDRGNYDVHCARKSVIERGMSQWIEKSCRTGRVENYPRLSYNVWRLVARAVKSCFPEEA